MSSLLDTDNQTPNRATISEKSSTYAKSKLQTNKRKDTSDLKKYDPHIKFIKTDSVSISKTKTSLDDYIIELGIQLQSPIPYRALFIVPDETRYSSSMPWHYNSTKQIFQNWFPTASTHKWIIVDATAHVGCDTILLAHFFLTSTVFSIEHKESTFSCLSNNIAQLESKQRIRCIQGSSVNIISKWNNQNIIDLLYVDPPWGGNHYKSQHKMRLYLDQRDVLNLFLSLLKEDRVTQMILKTPLNIDWNWVECRSNEYNVGFQYQTVYNWIGVSPKKPSYLLILFQKRL